MARIEEEIKQPQFKDEHLKAMINLMFTHHFVYEHNRLFLKKFGISSQQYNVLRILRGQRFHPISTQDVKARMLDRNSDTSRITDRLAELGLVEKGVRAENKRKADLVISRQGLELMASIDLEAEKMHAVMKKLSDEEAQQLNILLDKIRG